MTDPDENRSVESPLVKELNFQVGEVVRLLNDHPDDDLKAGDAGYVWCARNIPLPYYEADFYRADGIGTAMVFSAEEVELIGDPLSVCIPDEVRKFWRREAERHHTP